MVVFSEFPRKCFKISEKLSLAVYGSFGGGKLFLLVFVPFQWFEQKKVFPSNQFLRICYFSNYSRKNNFLSNSLASFWESVLEPSGEIISQFPWKCFKIPEKFIWWRKTIFVENCPFSLVWPIKVFPFKSKFSTGFATFPTSWEIITYWVIFNLGYFFDPKEKFFSQFPQKFFKTSEKLIWFDLAHLEEKNRICWYRSLINCLTKKFVSIQTKLSFGFATFPICRENIIYWAILSFFLRLSIFWL